MSHASRLKIQAERPEDGPFVENILDQAFGSERQKKAAYALRDGAMPLAKLCLTGWSDDVLVASIRFWPVHIFDALNRDYRLGLLLGPLAVSPDHQGQKFGSIIMRAGLQRARALYKETPILLVGDVAYYSRFGFEPVLPSYISLPGGRDAGRLLVQRSGLQRSLPAVGSLKPALFEEELASMRPQAIAV